MKVMLVEAVGVVSLAFFLAAVLIGDIFIAAASVLSLIFCIFMVMVAENA